MPCVLHITDISPMLMHTHRRLVYTRKNLRHCRYIIMHTHIGSLPPDLPPLTLISISTAFESGDNLESHAMFLLCAGMQLIYQDLMYEVWYDSPSHRSFGLP